MTTTSPLGRLTPAQREVLRALHRSGWRYAAAADELGMAETSVRTAVHRALARAGMSDRAGLAYWLGVEDERGRSGRANLGGVATSDAGALG